MNCEEFLSRVEKTTNTIHKKLILTVMRNSTSQLSPPYLKLLSIVKDSGPCSMTDIANELDVTLSAVTVLVDKLVDLDLVNRSRGRSDRRIVEIQITEKGKVTLEETTGMLRKLFNECYSSFTEEEIETCIRVMDKIAYCMDEQQEV